MARVFRSLFLPSPYIVLGLVLVFVPVIVRSRTLSSDTDVLRSMVLGIDPNSIPAGSYLSTWDFSQDPCETIGRFLGILCSMNGVGNTTVSRIISLELDSAGYDGFLMATIGNLSELTTLDVSRNRFRGPIPETISNLTKLTRISLADNVFTGVIPEGLSRMTNLLEIDLSKNHISGPVPPSLSRIRRLTSLSLADNILSGRIPDLVGLWRLRTLALDHNLLDGDLQHFPRSLTSLSLGTNFISGHLTPLQGFRNLQYLDLGNNRLSGAVTAEVLTLPMLNHINISFNQFEVIEVVNAVELATELRVLDAQGNLLRGHLPSHLVTFENLREIYLGRNRFTGPIPAEYGLRVGQPWTRLYLDGNFLTGDLPEQFTGLTLRGSVARNCLTCPLNVPLCRGGQRPATECIGQ